MAVGVLFMFAALVALIGNVASPLEDQEALVEETTSQHATDHSQRGLRVVAAIEAAKGILVLAVGLGLLTLIHKDLQLIAEEIVGHLHLNPARHYAGVFIDAIGKITDGRLWFLAGTALLYAILRLIEGYGLWWNMRWAKWLGVVTSGVYLPLEGYEMLIQASWFKLFVLALNIGVVGYLSCLLWQDRR